MLDARIDGDKDSDTIGATDADYDDVAKLEALRGSVDFGAGKAVVNEDTAKDKGWKVGDTLTLAFPAGKKLAIEIGGIAKENVTIFGVNVPLDVVEKVGIQRQDNALNITLDEGADPGTVQKALEKVAEPVPLVEVNDKEGFAETIRGQVNQLLYMIYGLLALAIIIAIIGIVNTLGLSVLERTREIGLLRSIGMTRRQLRRTSGHSCSSSTVWWWCSWSASTCHPSRTRSCASGSVPRSAAARVSRSRSRRKASWIVSITVRSTRVGLIGVLRWGGRQAQRLRGHQARAACRRR